jgi:Transposase IS116/IS110/IS902 family
LAPTGTPHRRHHRHRRTRAARRPDTAATLLTAIGDNLVRISTNAAFAKLCGVCALEASSGKTIRHRLNLVLSLGQFLFE